MVTKKQILVGFQGTEGSFSEQALVQYFSGQPITTKKFNDFEDVFIALAQEDIDYGILPIENSSTGGISDVYELLRQYNFFITGESYVKVEHNLLGLPDAELKDITEVYSHPQAFQQSSHFFKQHREMTFIPYANTALSAEFIKKMDLKNKASISSSRAAKLYGLKILSDNIQNNAFNYTRFVIINKKMIINPSCNKISIIVAVPHQSGALYETLGYFAKNNLSLLKIESKPIPNSNFNYLFYIDFEGNPNDSSTKHVLSRIEHNSQYFKLLGCYKNNNLADTL